MTLSTTASGRRPGPGVRGGMLAVGTVGMLVAGTIGVLGVAGLQHSGAALRQVAALDAALAEVRYVEASSSDVRIRSASYPWHAHLTDGAAAVAAVDTDDGALLDSAERWGSPLAAVPTEALIDGFDAAVATVEQPRGLIMEPSEPLEAWTGAAIIAAREQQAHSRWVMVIALAHGLVATLTLALGASRRFPRPLGAVLPAGAVLPVGRGEPAQEEAAALSATEQDRRDGQTVSAPPGQVAASTRRTASCPPEAGDTAARAVTAAQTSTGAVATAADSAAEIGHMVKVVRSIAEQASLLTINAAIEAARADEAVKGAAVVAGAAPGSAPTVAQLADRRLTIPPVAETATSGAVVRPVRKADPGTAETDSRSRTGLGELSRTA